MKLYFDPPIVFCIVFVAALLVAIPLLMKFSCDARWQGSGIESKWSFIGQCRIKVKGVWIPEGAYRELAP